MYFFTQTSFYSYTIYENFHYQISEKGKKRVILLSKNYTDAWPWDLKNSCYMILALPCTMTCTRGEDGPFPMELTGIQL